MHWPWSTKPSLTESLITLLRDQQAHQAALATAQIQALEEQSRTVREWLALFRGDTQPRVRVMTDMDEAMHESRRRAAGEEGPKPVLEPRVQDYTQWATDMQHTLQDLKAEM